MNNTQPLKNGPVRQRLDRGVWWVPVSLCVILLLFFMRSAPLALDPVRTQNAPDQFDTGRSLERLTDILDGKPHPVDSEPLDGVRKRLLNEISRLGYRPEVRTHNVCQARIQAAIRCARVENVFFRAGPDTGPALVLAAHYDSVDASPGFADDGIGIAVWLEVAAIFRNETLNQPVIFLFTDGEEAGLLGAQAFVDNREAYGFEVGRIINLEARGVRGPAMMFETGRPNTALVADWAKSGARPFSNSMMTAVYELLPNSTDLTVFLRSGMTGVNIAISDGPELYHTTRDDLASLDRASVQHMGDQALGAARAFLSSEWTRDTIEDESVYTDILSRFFVQLPQGLAVLLLGLCLGLSAWLIVRPGPESSWRSVDWRALMLPPVFILSAATCVFLIQQVFGLIRPETAYWTAYPQALAMTVFAVTLMTGCALLSWLAPMSRPAAIYASGWLWFLIVGMGLSLMAPGFVMIFLAPGFVFILGAAAAWLFPRFALIAYGAAALCLFLVFFPLIHLLDVTMGLSIAPVFAVVEAMVIAPALACIGPVRRHSKTALLMMAVTVCASGVATLAVPAFSADRPLALNFTAHYDVDSGKAAVFAGARPGALPSEIRAQLTTGRISSPPGAADNLAARELTFVQPRMARAEILSVESHAGAERILSLRLSAPGARSIRLRIPAEAKPLRVRYDGHIYEARTAMSGAYVIDVTGRAADGAVIDVMLASDAPRDWFVQGIWTGLPAEAAKLARLRPASALQIQMGDVSITTTKQTF